MSKETLFKTVQMTKWPEHRLPWKDVRAAALKKGQTVTQYVLDTLIQRLKGGW